MTYTSLIRPDQINLLLLGFAGRILGNGGKFIFRVIGHTRPRPSHVKPGDELLCAYAAPRARISALSWLNKILVRRQWTGPGWRGEHLALNYTPFWVLSFADLFLCVSEQDHRSSDQSAIDRLYNYRFIKHSWVFSFFFSVGRSIFRLKESEQQQIN